MGKLSTHFHAIIMKIHPIKNIQIIDDVFVCPEAEGIIISEFDLEFDADVKFIDYDHCECITSFTTTENNVLKIRLITDKNNIDEFLIFSLIKEEKYVNLKFRFKR